MSEFAWASRYGVLWTMLFIAFFVGSSCGPTWSRCFMIGVIVPLAATTCAGWLLPKPKKNA